MVGGDYPCARRIREPVSYRSSSQKAKAMLRAILFDFNGVISDDEHLHFAAFKAVLECEGVKISEQDYETHFLGKDDRDCFREALKMECLPLNGERLETLIQRKSEVYLRLVDTGLRVFPGVVSFIHEAYCTCALAIASGALRREIEFVLARTDLKRFFSCIVTQEDVMRGKPDPEIFLTTLAVLNRQNHRESSIVPEECLVVEDSRPGVEAALTAGMHCLAVTNSFSAEKLSAAHKVLPSLEIPPEELKRWIQHW